VDELLRELERIRDRDGWVAPSVVVEESRPDAAPLHGRFQWDDALAGEQYRLIQARNLIKSVVVTGPDGEPRSFYVHVASVVGGEGYYQTVEVLLEPSHLAEFRAAVAQVRQRFGQASAALRALERAAAGAGVQSARPIAVAARAIEDAREAVGALGAPGPGGAGAPDPGD